jgi:hypothetical protein
MHLFYRISDKSYVKPKMPGATKEVCLKNFLSCFADLIFTEDVMEKGKTPPITIIADNCTRETFKMVNETGLPIEETQLGNAGSAFHAIELAVDNLDYDDIVYFSEDDYLHQGRAVKLIEEGLKMSDYVTLYDHPDKYTKAYGGGESSRVLRTALGHWRYTISTCMTFGVKVKTLLEDIDIWKKWTSGDHPHDHEIFTELREKSRSLIVPIPGAACHLDMTFSGQANMLMMEDWAIEYLIQEFEKTMGPEGKAILGSRKGWERLRMAQAIKEMTAYK